MTGANGVADPDAASEQRRWDVALSFAGAQRDFVGQVAVALKARRVRCFYDADEQVRLWGTHLAEELPRIYARESAVVVVFVSADYAGGDWTRLERRAAFSQAVAGAGVHVLPARFDDSELPGLLPDVVAVDLRCHTPEQFADLVVAKLADLAIRPLSPAGGADRRPPGGVRASDADPRLLGVHAAISVPGVRDEVLPEYVPRDADAAEFGIRAKVDAAAQRGGFVVLVGGSSVGKTRSAVEAVKALMPEWWLVHPTGPAEVAALAWAPFPRMVVWLDELQLYLDGKQGLTGAVVRGLLSPPFPSVIIGTLWPDRYAAYTTMPASGSADPHARERQVLDLAAVVRIDAAFSPAEQDRARSAAARDRRLRIALEADGYGLTQTLAAAPQLVARWEDAKAASPYAWAVLTAALDVARLGGRAPLSAELLRGSAPGYCTAQQRAEAPRNWFGQALAYATGKLHGAAAALSPVGADVMGQVAGYTAADYLIQHASRERRNARLPSSTWDAIISEIREPADAARLAYSASDRLLYRYAIPLYRQAAHAGDRTKAKWLARRLADCGDLDGAQQILRAAADAGDGDAADWLANLLADREDFDGLRELARAGYGPATVRLAELLHDNGEPGEAEQILRAAIDAGDRDAAVKLADLLEYDGNCYEAEQVLRALADAGDRDAASRLADHLAGHGDPDEAGRVLRAAADADDGDAAGRRADLLADRGDLDGLRELARAGDGPASVRLAVLLADRGYLDEAEQMLRAQYAIGEEYADVRLYRLLADRGDLDGLRELANHDTYAAERLVDLLRDRGDLDEVEQILRARADESTDAARRLADLLAEREDLDGLRDRAEAGDDAAARRLAKVLADHGDLGKAEQILRAQADAGDRDAARPLTEVLIKQGRSEEADRLRWFGLNPDGSIASA